MKYEDELTKITNKTRVIRTENSLETRGVVAVISKYGEANGMVVK